MKQRQRADRLEVDHDFWIVNKFLPVLMSTILRKAFFLNTFVDLCQKPFSLVTSHRSWTTRLSWQGCHLGAQTQPTIKVSYAPKHNVWLIRPSATLDKLSAKQVWLLLTGEWPIVSILNDARISNRKKVDPSGLGPCETPEPLCTMIVGLCSKKEQGTSSKKEQAKMQQKGTMRRIALSSTPFGAAQWTG